MRINVDVADELMAEAKKITGLRTEQSVIEAGLQTLVQLKRQEAVKSLRGKLQWDDDLDDSRITVARR